MAAARPSLPVKPVKWKQRDYNEKFQIIYKFLNGVDPEDIMYLKKSYEMVMSIKDPHQCRILMMMFIRC